MQGGVPCCDGKRSDPTGVKPGSSNGQRMASELLLAIPHATVVIVAFPLWRRCVLKR